MNIDLQSLLTGTSSASGSAPSSAETEIDAKAFALSFAHAARLSSNTDLVLAPADAAITLTAGIARPSAVVDMSLPQPLSIAELRALAAQTSAADNNIAPDLSLNPSIDDMRAAAVTTLDSSAAMPLQLISEMPSSKLSRPEANSEADLTLESGSLLIPSISINDVAAAKTVVTPDTELKITADLPHEDSGLFVTPVSLNFGPTPKTEVFAAKVAETLIPPPRIHPTDVITDQKGNLAVNELTKSVLVVPEAFTFAPTGQAVMAESKTQEFAPVLTEQKHEVIDKNSEITSDMRLTDINPLPKTETALQADIGNNETRAQSKLDINIARPSIPVATPVDISAKNTVPKTFTPLADNQVKSSASTQGLVQPIIPAEKPPGTVPTPIITADDQAIQPTEEPAPLNQSLTVQNDDPVSAHPAFTVPLASIKASDVAVRDVTTKLSIPVPVISGANTPDKPAQPAPGIISGLPNTDTLSEVPQLPIKAPLENAGRTTGVSTIKTAPEAPAPSSFLTPNPTHADPVLAPTTQAAVEIVTPSTLPAQAALGAILTTPDQTQAAVISTPIITPVMNTEPENSPARTLRIAQPVQAEQQIIAPKIDAQDNSAKKQDAIAALHAQVAVSDMPKIISESVLTPAASLASITLESSARSPIAIMSAPINAANLTAQPALQTVADNIIKAHISQSGVTVRLDPPEMGNVTISFQFDAADRGVTAVIRSDVPETAALLRDRADILHQALKDSGFNNINLSFEQNNQNARNPFGNENMQGASHLFSIDNAANDDMPLPMTGLKRALGDGMQIDLKL